MIHVYRPRKYMGINARYDAAHGGQWVTRNLNWG